MDSDQNLRREKTENILFNEPTYIDPLTGLFNYLYLYQFLPREIEKAKLSGYFLSFLMIDLDGFKQVNDTYGHLCGDAILKEISKVFKKNLRRTDTIIRYAGDEFALILPAVDIAKAQNIAAQIINNIANTEFQVSENQKLRLTISIGFAVYPVDTDEIDQLIDMADKALYLSKQKGKNRAHHIKEVTLEAISFFTAMDSFPCQKFINRESELNKLKQIFDRVSASDSLQMALICGDIGTGKTRILNEIRQHLQDKVKIISYNASAKNVQDPYCLFAKGIGAYLEQTGIDNPELKNIFSRMAFEELKELALIIPQLALAIGTSGSQPPQTKAPLLLFKAFLDFLIELNKSSIILILIDDIHYADRASLALLCYLVRQEKNKRIFIAASLVKNSAKQISNDTDTKKIWDDIYFADNFTEIQLGNFLIGDVEKIVNAIFPRIGENKEFIELLYSITKGNPCFIEEMLKSIVEDNLIAYQNGVWQLTRKITIKDIPLSLEEVVKRRIKRLDPETKEMILQAAVIGDDFQLELLRKVTSKDEGFMFELIRRAKKMRFIDQTRLDEFHFVNKGVQNALYSELNDAQRSNLHYKVAKQLAAQHQYSLYPVAGELAFHFNKAPQEEETLNFGRVLSEMTSKLFGRREIIEYLESFAKEIVSSENEVVTVEISDEIKEEIIKLLHLLQGAIKNFRLYPLKSIIRENNINEIYAAIDEILVNKKVERIDISEVEKNLVINGRRVFPKELKQAYIEDFIFLLMNRNIKTISFVIGLQKEEIALFIQYLSRDYRDIVDKGGWAEVLKTENVKCIKIDEVKFITQGFPKESKDKDRIQNTLLIEYLLGKLDHTMVDKKEIISIVKNEPNKFAEAIMDVADNIVLDAKPESKPLAVNKLIEKTRLEILNNESKSDYLDYLARVVMELEPAIRNSFIRLAPLNVDSGHKEIVENVISGISDEDIGDIIIEEYNVNKGSLLKVKDFINNLLKNHKNKENVLSKLKSKLASLNIDEQDIAFLADEIKWEDLAINKKIDSLFFVSNDEFFMLESIDLKSILKELSLMYKKEELDSGINRLLTMAKKCGSAGQEKIITAVSDFIKEDFLDKDNGVIFSEKRTDFLLKRLEVETDAQSYNQLIAILKNLINSCLEKVRNSKDIMLELDSPQIRNSLLFINRAFFYLGKRLKLKEDCDKPILECVTRFILDISNPQFLEILISSFVNESMQNPPDIEEFFLVIKDQLVYSLINLWAGKIMLVNDSFKKYILQEKISNLLIKLGDKAFNVLKTILLEESKKEEVNVFLINIAGYLRKEEFIESLLLFIDHKDFLARRAVFLALREINTKQAVEIAAQAAKNHKDKKTRLLARSLLLKKI